MPEYTMKAEVTWDAVEVTVEAENEDEARTKFESGQWKSYDLAPASMEDWDERSAPKINQ